MPEFYQLQQGGCPMRQSPVPPHHPRPQAVRQQNPRMAFQQCPDQMPQQQPLRNVPQQAARMPQQGPYCPDVGSPQQQQRPLHAFSNLNQVSHHHNDIVPDEFNSFIEWSDLTASTLTEDEYRQYLSTPIVVRFEKVKPRAERNSAGERIKSTWLDCTRKLLPKFDSAQAEQEIKRLNQRDSRKGMTLPKKIRSLGPNAQTQITKAERDLAAAVQDPRFHIVLKQLALSEKTVLEFPRKGSKHHSKKPKKQRHTITAYFSRCPRKDQLPSALYRQLALEESRGHVRLDQQRREHEMPAHNNREERMRENGEREHEERMAERQTRQAEQETRQEEARARRAHEERMMATNHTANQGPQAQHMPQVPHMHTGQAMQMNQMNQMPQNQPQRAPGQQMHPSQIPQSQQQRPWHPQQAHFQPNNGHIPQGQFQRPPPHSNGMPPQGFVQMNQQQGQGPPSGVRQMPPQGFAPTGPQQGHQGPPPGVRQMPPPYMQNQQSVQHPHHQQGQFIHGPSGVDGGRQAPNGHRPVITVIAEPSHNSRHSRHHTRCSSSSGASSSKSDSDFERASSADTKLSSLSSGGAGFFPSAKPSSGPHHHHHAYVADDDLADTEDFVRVIPASGRQTPTRSHSVTRRRGETQYIQTASDRRINVPLPAPRPRSSSRRRKSRSPFRAIAIAAAATDPLTQVREAYLAGHADHERLAREYHPSSTAAHRLSTPRSGFVSADGMDEFPLPQEYQAHRPLAHSDTRPSGSGTRTGVFRDTGSLPGVRRMTESEVNHRLNRDARGGGLQHEDKRPLEERFARVRIVNSRTFDDDLDVNVLDERWKRRESRAHETLARDEQEAILRGLGSDERRRRASFDRDPFVTVSHGRGKAQC